MCAVVGPIYHERSLRARQWACGVRASDDHALCECGGMMFACCLCLRVVVMIVVVACSTIRCRIVAFRSLRRSLSLRAMPVLVRLVAR